MIILPQDKIKVQQIQKQKNLQPFLQVFRDYETLLEKYKHLDSSKQELQIKYEKLVDHSKDPERLEHLQEDVDMWQQKYNQVKMQNNESVYLLHQITSDFNNSVESKKHLEILTKEQENEIAQLKEKMNKLIIENEKQEEQIIQQDQYIEILQKDKLYLIDQRKQAEETKDNLFDKLKQTQGQLMEKYNEIQELHDQFQKKKETLKKDIEIFEKQKQDFTPRVSDEKPKTNFYEAEVTERNKKLIKCLKQYHSNEISSMSSSSTGQIVATTGGENFIKLFDSFRQDYSHSFQNPQGHQYSTLALSQRRDLILAANTNRSAHLFNSHGKLLHDLTGHQQQINNVLFLNSTENCLTASERVMKIWDLTTGFQEATHTLESKAICMDAFSYQSSIVVGQANGSIKIVSHRDNKVIHDFKNIFDDSVTCVSLSSNNNYLVSSYLGGDFLKCIDLRMNQVLLTLMDENYYNSHSLNKVCFGQDDSCVYAGNQDNSVYIFCLNKGQKKEVLKTNQQGIMINCHYIPMNNQLYSGDTRGNFFVWK